MTTNRKTVIVDSTTPTDGYVLTYSATDGYYKPLPSAGGNTAITVITVNEPGQTLSNTDMFLRVRMTGDGYNTVVLPSSPLDGMQWTFKDRDGYAGANVYSIDPNGKKIDMTVSAFTLPYSYSSLSVVYYLDDDNWEII